MGRKYDEHLEKLTDSTEKFSANEAENRACKMFDDLNLPSNLSLLDVGCGTGEITLHMARHLTGGTVTGIDISKSRIEYAKRHNYAKNMRYFDVAFDKVDEDKIFDVITFFSSFHWIANSHDALIKSLRLLAEQGTLVIQSYQKGLLRQAIDDVRQADRWIKYFYNFKETKHLRDQATYLKMLADVGFEPTMARSDSHFVKFSDPQSAAMSIAKWLEGVDLLPLGIRERFLMDIIEKYGNLDHDALDGNGTRLEFPIVEIVCRRRSAK